MNVAIRVDGNVLIGVGHVLRCLSLARKLTDYGVKCTFFARNISSHLHQRISSSFNLISLNGLDPDFKVTDNYSAWRGVREEFDAKEFLSKAKVIGFDAVIVDHYGLGYHWEKTVSRCCDCIIVLDDLANRHHACNVLVDQSLGRLASNYRRLVPPNCNLLVGPKFALLRDEFSNVKLSIEKQCDILINFGGADKDNYTEHVLNMLSKSVGIHNYNIKIIIGSDYPFAHSLEQRAIELGLQIKLIENPKNMAKEISECRIAIGAGGVSLLERSALGVPSIIYAIADNQKHICAEYERRGLGSLIIKGETDEHVKLASTIDAMLDPQMLSKRSHLNSNFVDAHGADRVVARLLKEFEFLTEVEATVKDTKFVYECRYEKTDTSLYVNSTVPSYECHVNWFSKNLVKKDCVHIIFKCGLEKIGYIRLDHKKNYFDVSIYLHSKYRSRGFAEIMLNKIIDRVGTQKLQASVHVKNEASLRVFLNCSFNIISNVQNFVRLEYC